MSGTAEGTRDSAIATAILRASIKSRCQQAGMSLAAMILNTAFCLVLLGRGVNGVGLATFLITCTGLLLVRYVVAARATHALPTATHEELARFDLQFRLVSLASQSVMGASIWIVWGARGEPVDEVSAYVMTLLICLYAVGTMVNLSHDFRSFVMTIPLLMVQPALFWLIRPDDGAAIAVILLGLMLLMISSVRNSRRTFEESIRIRFEKDDLLLQVEREKQTALHALLQAENANRSKSFFMAAASHDLRQPLYAATILCDTLGLHDLPPESSKLLTQQGKALRAASGLFDNLLDLTKFESGAIVPVLTPVNVRELLKEVENEFSTMCRAKHLSLTVVSTDLLAWSDYDLLDRLVRNLVSNAVRYTETGGVRVECQKRDERLLLLVEDTGIGIAPEDQARIFNEFVQVQNPHRSRDRGVGLGLAIVRHICHLLGCEVEVTSSRGQGTRMSLHVPIAPASVGMQNPVTDAAPPACDLRGQHVWIVDDDEGVRDALSAYFRMQNCQCATARSQEDLTALERANGALPDYALIDDMLSAHKSGLEVARWLATRVSARRILLMTGNSNPQRWHELSESGFSVLRKPIPALALHEWILTASRDGGENAAQINPSSRALRMS